MSLEKLQEAIDVREQDWQNKRLKQAQREAADLFEVRDKQRIARSPKHQRLASMGMMGREPIKPVELSLEKSQKLAKSGKLVGMLEGAWQELLRTDPDLCRELAKDKDFDPMDLLEVAPADQPLRLFVPGKRDIKAAYLASDGFEDSDPAGREPLVWALACKQAKKTGESPAELLINQAGGRYWEPNLNCSIDDNLATRMSEAIGQMDFEYEHDGDHEEDKDQECEPDDYGEPYEVGSFATRAIDIQPSWWSPNKARRVKELHQLAEADLGDSASLAAGLKRMVKNMKGNNTGLLLRKVNNTVGGRVMNFDTSIGMRHQVDQSVWYQSEEER